MNRHVPPHDLDRREAASFAPRSAPDFHRAARHSARVRVLRILLPVSLVVAAAILAGIAFLSSLTLKIDLPFEVGHLTLSGSRLTMELPKLSGFTDDNRGYSVTAKTASQDLTAPDLVDLADIQARLEMADKGWAQVAATSGTLNIKTQFVTLDGGVDLTMSGGYSGRLENAEVDVKAGTILTKQPVVFTYLDGRLVADRLTVSDRGKKALFEGGVQLDFRLSELPSGKKAGDGAGAPAPGAGQTAPGTAAAAGLGAAPAPAGVSEAAFAMPDAGAARAYAPAAAPLPIAPQPQAAAPAPDLPSVPMPSAPLPPRRPAMVQ